MFLFKNKFGTIRSGWHIVLASIIFIIMQTVFSIPGMYLHRRTGNPTTLSESGNLPWIELVMNGGGVVGAIFGSVLIWKLINKRKIVEFGLQVKRSQMKDFGFGLFLGAASMSLIFTVLILIGQIQLAGNLFSPQFSIYSLTFLILFLLVGFSEELFFRGYIMKTMEHRHNPRWLIYLMSALIFSLFHGLNPNVSLFGLINIGLVGLLFSYMYDVTKSLWMPIGYHITWNYFQGNVFGFPVSGTNPHGLYEITLQNSRELFTGGSFGPEGGLLATTLIMLGFAVTNQYSKNRYN